MSTRPTRDSGVSHAVTEGLGAVVSWAALVVVTGVVVVDATGELVELGLTVHGGRSPQDAVLGPALASEFCVKGGGVKPPNLGPRGGGSLTSCSGVYLLNPA